MSNSLCNGLVKNNHPKSPIAYFEILTVREYNDHDGGKYLDIVKNSEDFLDPQYRDTDEPFYQIYGKRYSDDIKTYPIFLGEFYSLDQAKDFLYHLTGETPDIISH